MGTCNFNSMTNFDLWAVGSDRFYSKCCPECNYHQDGDECELCGADLTDIETEFDDLAEMFFYEDSCCPNARFSFLLLWGRWYGCFQVLG